MDLIKNLDSAGLDRVAEPRRPELVPPRLLDTRDPANDFTLGRAPLIRLAKAFRAKPGPSVS